MSGSWAPGNYAWGECDRCGVAFKLHVLKRLTINLARTNLFVCPECWEADHPQYLVGRKPVVDPQALWNARPDNGLAASRDFQWGWAPVGVANPYGLTDTTNNLWAIGEVGDVVVGV